MKTGRSLQDWAKEIERRANAKRDFMVDTRSMEMFNGEQGPQVSLELKDSRLQLGMTENAHRQIGTHLNIPAKYYELMRKENPELLVQNVNSWLEKNPTRRLVRALDGDMRAFLSDRYRCIERAYGFPVRTRTRRASATRIPATRRPFTGKNTGTS